MSMTIDEQIAALPDKINGMYVKLQVQWIGKTKSHIMASLVEERLKDESARKWHADFGDEDYYAPTLGDALDLLLNHLDTEGIIEL